MAKKMYFGADNASHLVSKAYIGIDNVARKITKIYRGVGGVAKLVYTSAKGYLYGGESIISWSNEIMGAEAGSATQGPDYFTIDIEKTDGVPLMIYFGDTLISTIESSGTHTVSIDGGGTTLYNAGTLDLRIVSQSTYALSNMAFCISWMPSDGKTGTATLDYGVVTNARMSDNVVSISQYAFGDLSDGAVVSFPSEGLIEIGDLAFMKPLEANTNRGSGIAEFEIPRTVQRIGQSSFSGTLLQSITIPRNVIEIGGGAFGLIGLMSEITFEHGVNDPLILGAGCFRSAGEKNMTIYHRGNSVVLNYDWAADDIIATFIEV